MSLIAAIHAYSPASRSGAVGKPLAGPEKPGTDATARRKTDTVEISAEGQNRLARIQSRIQSGYYNSAAVAEDIGDKLSKVLDSMT